LKAGRGLIPFGPISGEPLHGAATNGTISRSVRDSAAMLDVLAGPDATVPYAPGMPASPFLDEVGRDPGRLKIGFHTNSAINANPHPSAIAAVNEAAKLLESLGHEVEPVAAPFDDAALARDFLTIWFVYAAYEVAEIKRLTGAGDDGFELDTLIMAALGRAISSVDHCAALERRHEHVRGLATFHQNYDLLLTPTLATPPPRIGQFDTPRALQPFAKLLLRTRTTRLLQHLGVVDKMIDDNLGWVPYTQRPTSPAARPPACRCTGRPRDSHSACSSSPRPVARRCCCGSRRSWSRRSRGRSAGRRSERRASARALGRPRGTVWHVPDHEVTEPRDGEVDVTVVLGRVDQSLVEQSLTDRRQLRRLAAQLGGDVARPVRTISELGHRSHVAPLLLGRALHAHLVDARVQRCLRSRHGSFDISDGDRR
jgi:hypothetical protein